MSDKKTEEKGILRFEEGMRNCRPIAKGGKLIYPRVLAVDILLDGEGIGCIMDTGRIVIHGHVIEKDPSTIMSYSNTFTSEQWDEIGRRKDHFKEKCRVREMVFRGVLEKFENLANRSFPKNGLFCHIEIAKFGHEHVVLGGGKGEYETYSPGIYIYDDIHYPDREVNIGYRSVSEQRITSAICLTDELLAEVLKAASSIDTLEG